MVIYYVFVLEGHGLSEEKEGKVRKGPVLTFHVVVTALMKPLAAAYTCSSSKENQWGCFPYFMLPAFGTPFQALHLPTTNISFFFTGEKGQFIC